MHKEQKQLNQSESNSQPHRNEENNPFSQSFAIQLPKIKNTILKNNKKDFSAYEKGAKIINELPPLIFSVNKANSRRQRIPKIQNALNNMSKPTVSPFFIKYISRSEQKRKHLQITRHNSQEARSNFAEVPFVSISNIKLQKYGSLKLSTTFSKLISPKLLKMPNKSRQISLKQEIKIHEHNQESKTRFQKPQITINQELNILKKNIIMMSKLPKSPKKNIFNSIQKRRQKSESKEEEKLTPWSSLKDSEHYF